MNNDLISRSALKKCAIPCEFYNGALTDLCVPLYQIDNAQTVEYTFEEAFQKTVCENRLYCHARPQGEWKLDSLGAYCSECGTHPDYSSNYCPNCGAKMKGGAE